MSVLEELERLSGMGHLKHTDVSDELWAVLVDEARHQGYATNDHENWKIRKLVEAALLRRWEEGA